MQVLKFGGTSVGSPQAIEATIQILSRQLQSGPLLAVVSAFGGVTDNLIRCGQLAASGDETFRDEVEQLTQRHLSAIKQLVPIQQQSSLLSAIKTLCNEVEDICNGIFLLGETTARSRDRLVSYGELMSSKIIAAAIAGKNLPVTWWDSRKLILTNAAFGNARVDFAATNNRFREALLALKDPLVLMPGFIAADDRGITTTLGRGGSDYTAAIAAAAVHATELQIWTDVSGMMTADPRWVPNAKVIPAISYQEAMELSHFGAKVIYPPTIQPVMNAGIPVRIKNTFAPDDPGTVVQLESYRNGNAVRGISSINHFCLISLEGSGMIGVPGFSRRLFEALSNEEINVILITQGSSEHSICVGIDAQLAEKAKAAVDKAFAPEITMQQVEPLIIEKELSIIALVGEQMKNHPGTSGRMFGVLGRNGVNVRAIAQGSSERNISAVIATRDARKAINLLHEEFFETTLRQINLFITGAGNVGSRLLEQIRRQQPILLENARLQLRVVGLANSRKAVFADEGIDLNNWRALLLSAADLSIDAFTDEILKRNLRNAVFADVTASEKVATVYGKLLAKSVAVVACNKIACSSPYAYYRALKDKASAYNTAFLFETN
nr:aspartate kinase [Flavihumibacter sp.]